MILSIYIWVLDAYFASDSYVLGNVVIPSLPWSSLLFTISLWLLFEWFLLSIIILNYSSNSICITLLLLVLSFPSGFLSDNCVDYYQAFFWSNISLEFVKVVCFSFFFLFSFSFCFCFCLWLFFDPCVSWNFEKWLARSTYLIDFAHKSHFLVFGSYSKCLETWCM